MKAEETMKASGGPKVTRSATVSVRLDSDLEYLARIAARIQRRTLSSYIEWAVEESLKSVYFTTDWSEDPTLDCTEEGTGAAKVVNSIAFKAEFLCEGDEVDRFMNLALVYRNVLNEEQRRLFRLIETDKSFLVKGKPVVIEGKLYPSFTYDRNAIRQRWAELKGRASSGESEAEEPAAKKKGGKA